MTFKLTQRWVEDVIEEFEASSYQEALDFAVRANQVARNERFVADKEDHRKHERELVEFTIHARSSGMQIAKVMAFPYPGSKELE